MARTGFFHHIGTFFLFAATVLLIITDISAPVVSSISLLRVDLGPSRRADLFRDDDNDHIPSITFGTFGYCTQNIQASGSTSCSHSKIGYDPVAVIENELGIGGVSDYAHDTARGLTKVMILHPIATGLAFISFLLALGAGFVGSLLASLGSLLTFVVVLVVLVTDLVCWAIIRSEVNGNNNSRNWDVHAYWGAASWTTLAAAILCLLATAILFFTCCSARLHRRRESRYRETKIASSSSRSPPRGRYF
ncbi:pali-domain-containing protein [Xylariaceae sp. FL0594]|nr:pali-domain-containing protein [Xylariaceae sp. FL0594]